MTIAFIKIRRSITLVALLWSDGFNQGENFGCTFSLN